jgi:hypothetical protein
VRINAVCPNGDDTSLPSYARVIVYDCQDPQAFEQAMTDVYRPRPLPVIEWRMQGAVVEDMYTHVYGEHHAPPKTVTVDSPWRINVMRGMQDLP